MCETICCHIVSFDYFRSAKREIADEAGNQLFIYLCLFATNE